jgi:DNA-directed RNA polymerase subunit RPC12/RpoP
MKAKAYNCINCKAPLSLLGNASRCRQLICQYCGTVMDVRNNFKALYTLKQIDDNKYPLQIGMPLTFQEVTFRITGFIVFAAKDLEWLQYQLYSPTHGYAKLIYKQDLVLFFRKTHYLPKPNIWLLKNGDSFMAQKQPFSVDDYLFSEVYYAAGSLINNISQGKRYKHCFAQSQSHWFYSEFNRDALANYMGQQLSIDEMTE